MKNVVLSLCLSLMWGLRAQAIQPENVCSLLNCSEPMKAISAAFATETGPVEAAQGRAYSGVCYYHSGSTPPDLAHAGLGVFSPDLSGKLIEYRGVFSFYGKPADYASMTYEDAYKKVYSERAPSTLKNGPRYSGYVARTEKTAFSYWFGSSADGQSLKLISIWVYEGQIGQTAFCDWQLNPK